MMTDLGYTNVAHMDGGITAWKDSGRPVISSEVSDASSEASPIDTFVDVVRGA